MKRSKIYKKFKKDYCENIDSRLGFVCNSIIIDTSQLDVDHINENRHDNSPENLQTLCANCHRIKTRRNSHKHNKPTLSIKPTKGDAMRIDIEKLEKYTLMLERYNAAYREFMALSKKQDIKKTSPNEVHHLIKTKNTPQNRLIEFRNIMIDYVADGKKVTHADARELIEKSYGLKKCVLTSAEKSFITKANQRMLTRT